MIQIIRINTNTTKNFAFGKIRRANMSMESIKETSESRDRESIEKLERFEVIHDIRNNVLDTFPFEHEQQKKDFKQKIDFLLDDLLGFSKKEIIEKIKIILASLDNSHTSLEKKVRRKISS